METHLAVPRLYIRPVHFRGAIVFWATEGMFHKMQRTTIMCSNFCHADEQCKFDGPGRPGVKRFADVQPSFCASQTLTYGSTCEDRKAGCADPGKRGSLCGDASASCGANGTSHVVDGQFHPFPARASGECYCEEGYAGALCDQCAGGYLQSIGCYTN